MHTGVCQIFLFTMIQNNMHINAYPSRKINLVKHLTSYNETPVRYAPKKAVPNIILPKMS